MMFEVVVIISLSKDCKNIVIYGSRYYAEKILNIQSQLLIYSLKKENNLI